jgi:hypothetical protein
VTSPKDTIEGVIALMEQRVEEVGRLQGAARSLNNIIESIVGEAKTDLETLKGIEWEGGTEPGPGPAPGPGPEPEPEPAPNPAPPTTGRKAPPAINPSAYDNQVQADKGSFSRIVKGLKPKTAVLLAPGHYDFTKIKVPGCLYYATRPGTVFVDGRVELHTPDTAVLALDIGGGLVLDGDRSRASLCVIHDSNGVDLVSIQGADNVCDWCEVSDFAGIGFGVQAKTARRPVVVGLHVHSQLSAGPPSSGTMFMIGHDHRDSDQPVQGYFGRILIEGARSHDGFEVKCSDIVGEDITAIGCDVMQRHGMRAATFLSCWAEPKAGKGGRIQLNSNNPKAICCRGLLGIAAGNGSVEDLFKRKPGSASIYPFARGAEGHHHNGPVVIGDKHGTQRPMPPIGTKLDSCPKVQVLVGGVGKANPIPADKLPRPARRLTQTDVGLSGGAHLLV